MVRKLMPIEVAEEYDDHEAVNLLQDALEASSVEPR